MLGLSLSLCSIAVRGRWTPAPTPTPTPGIAEPVITQTSTPTTTPFTFSVLDDPSFFAGFYWNVQRAADGSFSPLNGEAIQQITPEDLTSDDPIIFTDLSPTPVGPLRLRLRVGHEDGEGGYTWGDWSNVLSDTIALTYSAVFSTDRRTLFGGQTGTISNGGRTYNGYDFGSEVTFRAATGTALSAAIGYVEFTHVPDANGLLGVIGLVGSAYDFTGASSELGKTASSWGIIGDVGGVAGVYAGNGSLVATPPQFTAGGVYGLLVHKATGKVWYRHSTGWFPDTPSFNSDGTIASGTGYASGLTEHAFAVGTRRGEGFTINAGQATFTYARPANVPGGWA